MPVGYGDAVFTTSSGGDVGGGRRFTRHLGPLLVGQKLDNPGTVGTQTGAAPLYAGQPSHLVLVSTTPADLVWGQSLTSTPTQGFVYIPQTTSIVVTSSGGGVLTTPTPVQAGGVALVWDSGRNKLCAFSTVANGWLTVTLTSS